MTLREDAVAVLSSWEAGSQAALRDRYVEHLLSRENSTLRDCYPDHLTASMLVVSHDHSRVLLTLHGRARRWFQLGGHCERGDATLAGAATREALEESGLSSIVVDPQPIHLDEHAVPFCSAGPDTHHLDVRFLAVASEGAEHSVSEESLEVRWWPLRALPSEEHGLRALVAAGLHRLDQLGSGLDQPGMGRDQSTMSRASESAIGSPE